MQEQEKSPVTGSIFGQLIELNAKIGRIYSQKETDGHLTSRQKERLEELHQGKYQLVVGLLKLRKAGNRQIKVAIVGNSGDSLHTFSRNAIQVRFPHPNPAHKTFSTKLSLSNLHPFYQGELEELIGLPDEFIDEPVNEYIIRTIAEISELGHDSERAEKMGDLAKKEELHKLKINLAERIIKLRASGQLTRSQLKIGYFKNPSRITQLDLIEIKFFPGRGLKSWSFHLLPRHHLFLTRLAPLIERIGGYDRETLTRR